MYIPPWQHVKIFPKTFESNICIWTILQNLVLRGKKIHIFNFKYFWNFKNLKKMSFYIVLKLLICEYTDVSLQQEYENV